MELTYGAYAFVDALGMETRLRASNWYEYIKSLERIESFVGNDLVEMQATDGKRTSGFTVSDSIFLMHESLHVGGIGIGTAYSPYETEEHIEQRIRSIADVNVSLVRLNVLGKSLSRLMKVATYDAWETNHQMIAFRGCVSLGLGYANGKYWAGNAPLNAIKMEKSFDAAVIATSQETTNAIDASMTSFQEFVKSNPSQVDCRWDVHLGPDGCPRYLLKVPVPIKSKSIDQPLGVWSHRYVVNPFTNLPKKQAEKVRSAIISSMGSQDVEGKDPDEWPKRCLTETVLGWLFEKTSFKN